RLVLHPELHVRQIVAHLPVVARPQIPLERRRVGERAPLGTVNIGDRSPENPLPGSLVLYIKIRDRLAETGARRQIPDQRRRILQLTTVPGGCAVDRQAAPYIGRDLQLHTPDLVIRPVRVVRQVAKSALRTEEADLGVAPVLLIDGTVHLETVVEPHGLPANLV